MKITFEISNEHFDELSKFLGTTKSVKKVIKEARAIRAFETSGSDFSVNALDIYIYKEASQLLLD
jgi:superfamily I DNA and/or RNA helicase